MDNEMGPRVWEKLEITLEAENSYENAYTEVDSGLVGTSGTFEAAAWSEEEKRVNSNRRGIVRATSNGHALQYADGTPFYHPYGSLSVVRGRRGAGTGSGDGLQGYYPLPQAPGVQ